MTSIDTTASLQYLVILKVNQPVLRLLVILRRYFFRRDAASSSDNMASCTTNVFCYMFTFPWLWYISCIRFGNATLCYATMLNQLGQVRYISLLCYAMLHGQAAVAGLRKVKLVNVRLGLLVMVYKIIFNPTFSLVFKALPTWGSL